RREAGTSSILHYYLSSSKYSSNYFLCLYASHSNVHSRFHTRQLNSSNHNLPARREAGTSSISPYFFSSSKYSSYNNNNTFNSQQHNRRRIKTRRGERLGSTSSYSPKA